MKIYVISLEGAKERRTAITEKFQELGLEFEFFNAVDGRFGLPKEYNILVDWDRLQKRLGDNYISTELSASLSHAMVYKRMVRLGIPEAIILEDDAIIDKDFKKMVQGKVLQKSQKDFVLLYHLFASAIYFSKEAFMKGYSMVRLARTPSGATGYYLTLSMAKHLFDAVVPVSYVADWGVELTGKNVGAIVPRIVQHPSMDSSSIEKSRKKKKSKIYQFGFLPWLVCKIKKPFAYKVSPRIEGQ